MKKVLAFDMGATSIRGIVGYVENGQFCTKEVMRMSHKIQNRDGRLYWDFNAIAKKVEDTILENPDVSAIGIDTWGVDFGVIDKEGNLLQAPHSYRDEKFAEGREEARALLSFSFSNKCSETCFFDKSYSPVVDQMLSSPIFSPVRR